MPSVIGPRARVSLIADAHFARVLLVSGATRIASAPGPTALTRLSCKRTQALHLVYAVVAALPAHQLPGLGLLGQADVERHPSLVLELAQVVVARSGQTSWAARACFFDQAGHSADRSVYSLFGSPTAM